MDGTSHIIHIIDIVLHQWDVKFDSDSIRKILYSDPSFPSIKAILGTLAYYGLKSNVYKAGYEHIIDKPFCVIHTNQDDGHFFYVKEIDDDMICLYDGTNHTLKKSEFLDLWDGVVLLVEEKVFTNMLSHSLNKTSLFILLLVFSLVASIPLVIGSFNTIVQLLFDTIGIAFSCLLYGQSLFAYRNIPFCHIGNHFDCTVVSKANPIKHFIPIGLPEVGIVFFIFDWLFLLIEDNQSCCLLYVYWFAVACMVALIACQLIVIRKYCFYCLCISFVVFAKLFLLQAENYVMMLSIFQILNAVVIAVSIATIIIMYGKTLKNEKENSLKLLAIKRTPHVFNLLLHRKPQVNIIKDHALLFGNENAPITFDTIISLNCRHCKRMVKEMCVLLTEMPNAFCWRVYIDGINMDNDNPTSNNLQLHLISQYLNDRSLAFHCLKEWDFCFTDCTISSTAQVWYTNLIADIRQMGIEHYPTILLNKHPFPSEYKMSDMKFLINDWQQRGTAL